MDEARLHRKNTFKIVRTVLEVLVIFAVVFAAVHALYRRHVETETYAGRLQNQTLISDEEILAGYESVGHVSGPHFIAISYNGLTDVVREGGKIVTVGSYEEQMQALKASGYQTITHQDVINYYKNGSALPEKAMLLIFEDGILNTTELAQPAMIANNYIATACTFAENLSDTEDLYITADGIKKLNKTTYWETGSNGYRVSYINVFDRYENYFGELSTREFLAVHDFLRRDYNHYLMDFIRDENRLRTESESAMEERIARDYEKMEELYQENIGYVPSFYLLMNSNTGAFGNDPLVSRKNAEMIERIFEMNFNRQGSCLNTRDSSIYDLSRLQVRQYFSTNHLMMRIWDDTGHHVMFCLGDQSKAEDWTRTEGVTEFTDDKIIVTSLPYGQGELLLNRELPRNLELAVRLQGNTVGQQAVVLRADENGEGGVTVRLHNNVLYIEDDDEAMPLLKVDLFELDGGPFVSEAEEELNGLIALQNAIIKYDEDEARILEAEKKLELLNSIRSPGLDDGAAPYIPELDIDDEDNRELRIRLENNTISCWVDGIQVADKLSISAKGGNRLFLQAAVTRDDERFSQTNLSDDVYDGIFTQLSISDLNGEAAFTYASRLVSENGSELLDSVLTWIGRLLGHE